MCFAASWSTSPPTSPTPRPRPVERAVTEFGGLDLLVNNAGGPPPGVDLPRFGSLGLSDEDWLLTPWWTEEGGAAEIFAAHVSSDRETSSRRWRRR